MSYGVQFRGALSPNQTQRWFTFNWPVNRDVAWLVVPTTPQAGSPHVQCTVATELTPNNTITYWLTIQNLTSDTFNFEARYDYLD